jgi:hypothetical protein
VLPAGFAWRGGRPRWIPSPTRRKAGWRALDLKDAWGRWLAKGEAIARAEEIAGAVAAWAAGEAVTPALAAIAPKGAELAGRQAGAGAASIGALIDAFLADPMPRTRALAPKTLADYKSKLGRLVALMAESQRKTPELLRSLNVAVLMPPPPGCGDPFLLDDGYRLMRTAAGEHMAHGAMLAASAWLSWVVRRKRLLPFNPCDHVARAQPAGRIVVYDWPELRLLAAAAEHLGHASIADAIVLGIDLSWSQQDLLGLAWPQISADGHVAIRRIKTGVLGNPPLLAIGRARLEAIRRRQGKEGEVASIGPVILCERTGQAWSASDFQKRFAEVRAIAASHAPALAAKQFRDLRDTAITFAGEAALDAEDIATRSAHAAAGGSKVMARHYLGLTQRRADAAAEKLDAWLAAQGYHFDDLKLPEGRATSPPECDR